MYSKNEIISLILFYKNIFIRFLNECQTINIKTFNKTPHSLFSNIVIGNLNFAACTVYVRYELNGPRWATVLLMVPYIFLIGNPFCVVNVREEACEKNT